jgi:hypothetical protein
MLQAIAATAVTLGASGNALAFGSQGHEVVGAIADKLLRPPAAAKVKTLLGNMPLRRAATWADCAKNVEPVAGLRGPAHGAAGAATGPGRGTAGAVAEHDLALIVVRAGGRPVPVHKG